MKDVDEMWMMMMMMMESTEKRAKTKLLGYQNEKDEDSATTFVEFNSIPKRMTL